MGKSPSYRKSSCCGGCDCDFLDDPPNEICWGEVEMTSSGDDEDGWPLPNHLCRGHRNHYEYWMGDEFGKYIPEPDGPQEEQPLPPQEVTPLPYDGPTVWSNAKITNHWDLVFQYENKPLCWVKDGEVSFADDFTEEKLEELGGEDGNRGVAILFLEVYRLREQARTDAGIIFGPSMPRKQPGEGVT